MATSFRFSATAVLAVAVLTVAAPEPASAACGRPPENRPGYWCYVDGVNVRVWWNAGMFVVAGGGDEATAMLVRNEIEGYLWNHYRSLLGRQPLSDAHRASYPSNGGDGRYDIMLVDDLGARSGLSPIHFSLLRGAPPPPARYSLINARLPRTELLAAIAHELMYGFLSAFGCSNGCEWLREATAAWAEHYAYPLSNTEHRYAASFFANPTRPLDDAASVTDRRQSGAYVFLLFLQHRGGAGSNDAGIVRSIWEATEQFSTPLGAIDATLSDGLRGVWRDFIAHNWNAAPLVSLGRPFAGLSPIYWVWDLLVHGVRERRSYVGPTAVTLGAGSVHHLPLLLPRLSAAYYVFDFKATDVRSVELLHNMRDLQGTGAELTIFTKAWGRDWRVATYNPGTNSRTFCRDRADENLEQMVVVFGNSTLDSVLDSAALGRTPTLAATSSSCLTGSAGYQECRIDIRTRAGDLTNPYEYIHEETQTWEISGPPRLSGSSTFYPYLWTTRFSGEASNRNALWWESEWSRTGSSNGELEVWREAIAGGWQHAARHSTQASLPTAVIGWEATGTSAGRADLTQAAGEMPSLKKTAPSVASRIEGTRSQFFYLSAPPPGAEVPESRGAAHGNRVVTTHCRWSWPGA